MWSADGARRVAGGVPGAFGTGELTAGGALQQTASCTLLALLGTENRAGVPGTGKMPIQTRPG